MLRSILCACLLLGFSFPAWGEQVVAEYECTSGKLKATRGQVFNVNVVPHDDDTIFLVEGEIIRPATPGFFGNPKQVLASGIGPSTEDIPFQLSTNPTNDNGVEAYARVELLLGVDRCVGGFLAQIFCLLELLPSPGVGVFRLGSDNMVDDGTNAAISLDCRFDGFDEVTVR